MDEEENTQEGSAAEEKPLLKRRGRPKGSKNKPKPVVHKPKRRFEVTADGVDVFWRRG